MTSDKRLFAGLKWAFSFFILLMGIAAGGALLIWMIFNNSSLPTGLRFSVKDLPVEVATLMKISSPLFIATIVGNILLYGMVFYLARRFFKNLEKDQIFVPDNVSTAKKIAAVLLVLSVTSCLPDWFLVGNSSVLTDTSVFDLTYVMGSIIIWALAKILEKANMIALENDLTI